VANARLLKVVVRHYVIVSLNDKMFINVAELKR